MEDNGIKMLSEPAVAYPMTSYADVMEYIHSLHISHEDKEKVAKRLTLEVTGKNLSKAFDRLDSLCRLQNDWDGCGASKISPYVLNNIRKVLLISDDEDWKDWMISPAPNGTLGLQSKRHVASISIGDKEFSYFCSKDEVEEGDSHILFVPSTLLNLMRRIV